jgi:hypothetical protein
MWKKKGKGLAHKGQYHQKPGGERVMLLVAIRKDGTVSTVQAESWQMLKAAGWEKVG